MQDRSRVLALGRLRRLLGLAIVVGGAGLAVGSGWSLLN